MLTPLGDRIIIKPDHEAEKLVGGIIVKTASDPYKKGIVAAVSKDIESKLKEGDNVLYEAGAGTPVEDEGIKYLLMKESNIAVVL